VCSTHGSHMAVSRGKKDTNLRSPPTALGASTVNTVFNVHNLACQGSVTPNNGLSSPHNTAPPLVRHRF
jgi:hypothetical protein